MDQPAERPQPARDKTYSDATLANGPVHSASVRRRQLKVNAIGAQLPAMLGSNPTPVSVGLSNGIRNYCMEFGGAITYRAGARLSGHKPLAPAACPN